MQAHPHSFALSQGAAHAKIFCTNEQLPFYVVAPQGSQRRVKIDLHVKPSATGLKL